MSGNVSNSEVNVILPKITHVRVCTMPLHWDIHRTRERQKYLTVWNIMLL